MRTLVWLFLSASLCGQAQSQAEEYLKELIGNWNVTGILVSSSGTTFLSAIGRLSRADDRTFVVNVEQAATLELKYDPRVGKYLLSEQQRKPVADLPLEYSESDGLKGERGGVVNSIKKSSKSGVGAEWSPSETSSCRALPGRGAVWIPLPRNTASQRRRRIKTMIEDMEQVHMTDAEVASDFPAVLEKLQRGFEVVVEHDQQPVAIIRLPKFQGRSIDECIATLEACGSHATLDDEFAHDLEAIINSHREPLNPPAWD